MFKKFISANLKDQILYLKDLVLRRPNLDNGFIEEKVKTVIARGDYFLGASDPILRSDGQWDAFASQGELQRQNDQDKMACVTFSAHNTIENIINFYLAEETKGNKAYSDILNVFRAFSLIKNGECNVSDRYTAKMSGTSLRGNSQQVVANSIRHNGLVPEDKWPYVSDWDEYYKPIPSEIIKLGEQFAEYIDTTYKWDSPFNFVETLKRAPAQTSVYAGSGWFGEGIIQRDNQVKNHAVGFNGYVIPQYKKLPDSYEPFQKKVAWNFDLGQLMVFLITLKKKFSNQPMIDQLIARGFQYIQNVQGLGEVYLLTSTGLRKVEPSELNDDYVRQLATGKRLIGVSAEMFSKLTN